MRGGARGCTGVTAMDWVMWRYNRLRCMSPAEIGHRVLRAVSVQAERCGLIGSDAAPAPDFSAHFAPHFASGPRPWVQQPSGIDAAPYLAAADRLVAGEFDIFVMEGARLGSPPAWNRDPKTGVEAPLAFGKMLDYRNARLVGDIKYLWELNRHLHLVTLAQAYALSGERRYAEVLRDHLESWIESCPYRIGANWSSALEPALRLINWAVAWQLLGGVDSPLFRDARGAHFRKQWLASIYQHTQFVHGHFSLYSSANNHLLGESAGVFIAAMTWPYWPRERAWVSTAKSILEREAVLQNFADGVNREQAVSYQQFALDFLLLPLLSGRANGVAFSTVYEARVEAMLEYLASIMDAGGNLPMFGDADDGMVVRFSQALHDARGQAPSHTPISGKTPGVFFLARESCIYRSLLATGAILFHRGDFKHKARTVDDKTRWLLGDAADAAFAGVPERCSLPVRRAFPEGGYYILGSELETAGEIRLIADAGALGYQTIAAHGHADALSFVLSAGGMEFLIDPGTYAYHTHAAWRHYFRGTAAHNTVRIDGLDQSESGGNFMWLRKANAGCNHWSSTDERDEFEGWHDGYTHLPDPVAHTRRISLYKPEKRIVIEDTLRMTGTHDVELFFHCHEHCGVTAVPGGYSLSRDGRALMLQLPAAEGAAGELLRGSVSPIAGWVSRRFDEKQPTATIVWRARLSGTTVLRSEIAC